MKTRKEKLENKVTLQAAIRKRVGRNLREKQGKNKLKTMEERASIKKSKIDIERDRESIIKMLQNFKKLKNKPKNNYNFYS